MAFDTKVEVAVYDSPQHVNTGDKIAQTQGYVVGDLEMNQAKPAPFSGSTRELHGAITNSAQKQYRTTPPTQPQTSPTTTPAAPVLTSIESDQWRDALLLAKKLVESTGGMGKMDPLEAKAAAQRILSSMAPQHIVQYQLAAAC